MQTPIQEMIDRINTVDNLRSLVTWVNKNKESLLEKESKLMHYAKLEGYNLGLDKGLNNNK